MADATQIEMTVTYRYTPIPGSDGYDDCTDINECLELDTEQINNEEVDVPEMIDWDLADVTLKLVSPDDRP